MRFSYPRNHYLAQSQGIAPMGKYERHLHLDDQVDKLLIRPYHVDGFQSSKADVNEKLYNNSLV